MITMMSTP